jgi:hypothetical protein
MKAITREDKRRFLDLACQLSPENLCCDGEISMAQARRREWFVRDKWSKLEAMVGRKVSEDEVWNWTREDNTL